MPFYKDGKKEHIIPFEEVKRKIIEAKLAVTEEAFFWLLYYCGVRKSEAYERVADDFEVTEQYLIVDFQQRKKGGAKVPPLELPLYWQGVDKIVRTIQRAMIRPSYKSVFVYEPTGETRVTKKGKIVPVRKRIGKLSRGRWLFPRIQSTKAWEIVRQVLGEGYYPHFLRLNRLTEIGMDPTASLTRLKSFSGIKSARVLDDYLGTSKKEQQKAIKFMDSKYS